MICLLTKKRTQIKIGKQIIITINSRESIIKHGVWRDQVKSIEV